MDRIALRGIRAFGVHGVNPEERDAPQAIDVDLVIDVDTTAAQVSDDLEDTIDYAALHTQIVDVVASTSFGLLERLAGLLLEVIFEDSRIERAEITVAKPGILDGATPSVTIARER